MYARVVQGLRRTPPLPSRLAIAIMTAECVGMYRHVPSPGHPIPVGLQPFPVEDYIPEEEDIAWAVRCLEKFNHIVQT